MRIVGMPVLFGIGSVFALGAQGASATDIDEYESNELYQALYSDAAVTLHVRSYLFDRTDTTGSDPAAWAAGGWIGYESGWVDDFLKFGAVGYTSLPLWAPEDRVDSLLLKNGTEGFAVLGQAYIALKFEDQIATFYRQLVNQPEVNPQDNRMVPNTFEAATIKGDFGPVSYYGGYLFGMKKRNSDEFVNMAKAAGVSDEDSDMWLGGLEFTPLEGLKLRSSLYAVPDLLASSYSDAVWTSPTGPESKLRVSGQFMYQQSIGDDLLMGCSCDTWAAGAKSEFILGKLTLTAGYTQTGEGFNYQSPYGSWAGYTSMIVKDFDRAGEKALLLGISFDFAELGAEGLVFNSLAALDLDVDNDVPRWDEYDFTLDYRLTTLEDTSWDWLAPLWLRARYAYVDIGGDDNLNDFRVIANYEIQFKGGDL